ncbi:hypothetical protein HMPREF1143_1991 [Peptoanaerobacter stomatis]|uniref:Uncharacterized protein n=1 Tax=Peptoanaerobacter stomatis TaxID=796937 RepID=J6HEL6_9FIRM|nr:hypothetical protein [Peptoanaerobacter stomatis]EJU21183.1 hypothetical protein HMPREF1143_1991 [Peptoanaerobacter stomatis]
MENKTYVDLVLIAFPVVSGILIFFIKRLMNNHDRHGEKIVEIEKNYVKKEELEKKQKELKNELQSIVKEQITDVKDDIRQLKSEFSDSNNKTLKAVESLSKEVNDIKINYIDKNEFVRQNTALSTKLDKILDMIVEEKEKNAYKK